MKNVEVKALMDFTYNGESFKKDDTITMTAIEAAQCLAVDFVKASNATEDVIEKEVARETPSKSGKAK